MGRHENRSVRHSVPKDQPIEYQNMHVEEESEVLLVDLNDFVSAIGGAISGILNYR